MATFLPQKHGIALLDCATGTADQIITLMDRSDQISFAVGIDLALEMLEIAKKKLMKKPYWDRVELRQASLTDIPYPDESFDCVTVSFGIRNVPDLEAALKELRRVLKKGGRLLILEFSMPQNRMVHSVHLAYLRHCIPAIGGFFAKNKGAYAYLNKTIETFPFGEQFRKLLDETGFQNTESHPLSLGIATIYQGDR